MHTVYVDVLIVLNAYVNWFLLEITAKITHTPLRAFRCVTASLYGSLFSLLILVPRISPSVNLLIKTFAVFTIVITAFGFQGKKRLLVNTGAFFTANFVLAGTVYAVYSWFRPDFMHFNNSCFYIDFSLVVLILTTAVLYFTVCGVNTFLNRTPESTDCYKISVRYGGKTVVLRGIADTGNSLTDFFSGSPVIVCDKSRFSIDRQKPPSGFRLLPYSTISDGGLIPVFRPDEVVITNSISGERKRVDALIGLAVADDKAVFNPRVLKN